MLSHTFFWQLCATSEELRQFMQNTLLSVQSESQSLDIIEQLETSLDSLQKLGHVNISGPTESRKIEVTHLGQATFKGLHRLSKAKYFNERIRDKVKENIALLFQVRV